MELLKLRYRMYGLVPYNISPIQQGIQFGHAVVDYQRTTKSIKPFNKMYDKWADEDKTFIILNGGTTNKHLARLGTLNTHVATLRDAGIQVQEFCEPDLGDQLTAVVFLVDERVWDKEKYPDPLVPMDHPFLTDRQIHDHAKWIKSIGGENNLFLRKFLSGFRLA